MRVLNTALSLSRWVGRCRRKHRDGLRDRVMRMVIHGEGEVSHILRLAGCWVLPAVKASVEGGAEMELQIARDRGRETCPGLRLELFSAGSVRNGATAQRTGTVRGVNGPIEISSAELRLLHEEVRVEKLSAQAADADWTGSLSLPRGCGTPGACLIRFNLNTDEMDLSELSQWLSAHPSQRRWYQALTFAEPAAAPSFLKNLRAVGKVNAGRLQIRNLVANRVSASLDLEHGKLKISDLRADLLGGKHRGDWQADFAVDPPAYTGTGTLAGISLQQVAEAMHDPWISGTAEGTYRLTASAPTLRHSGNRRMADCSSICETEFCRTFR